MIRVSRVPPCTTAYLRVTTVGFADACFLAQPPAPVAFGVSCGVKQFFLPNSDWELGT